MCARFLQSYVASLIGLLPAKERMHVWRGLLQACRRGRTVALVVHV